MKTKLTHPEPKTDAPARRHKRDLSKIKAKRLPHDELMRLARKHPAPAEFWDDPVDPFKPEKP